mgnify:CR=1 FL=1
MSNYGRCGSMSSNVGIAQRYSGAQQVDEDGLYYGFQSEHEYRYKVMDENSNFNFNIKPEWTEWTKDLPHQYVVKNKTMMIIKYERRECE